MDESLLTPCLLLDYRKLRRNISMMNDVVASLSVNLRPHAKTNKSKEITRMLVDGHDGGITVSTLAEARYFSDAGFDDILYAVGIVPSKLPFVATLIKSGIDMKIVLDSRQVAEQVNEYGAENSCVFDTLIEIDCDGHRGGLRADSNDLIQIARELNDGAGSRMSGIMTQRGIFV